MSLEATPEQDATIARLKSAVALVGGTRVYDEVPEETILEKDATGLIVQPYIIASFGGLIPLEGESSIEGADQQPQIMPGMFECWAHTKAQARQLAGQVRVALVGWTPGSDGNASEWYLGGGGSLGAPSGLPRPTRYMELVTAETTINNSIVV